MTIKVNKKIVGYKVAQDSAEPNKAPQVPVVAPASNIIQMHEKLERPDMLLGSTYKIKTPLTEHALYVTINDVVLNAGTEHELRRPFEIFINSKNMDHFQWIVALTRIISAVFRKGGDITFLTEELHSVFDPRGGYFKKGGKFMPSLVAEIGDAIENHLRMIGMLKSPGLDEHQQRLIAEKRAEYETRHKGVSTGDSAGNNGAFPDGAQLCVKCSTKAMIKMDGCLTCLNCGDSKCG
ncbi:MAG: NrdJb [Gammaproteobacteria bacterium]|nr:NrdJb [Gammaproteobacteria bacterium]